MQAYLTLTRRELGAFFLSMTGYIIIAATLFLVGFSLVLLVGQLQQDPTPVPVTELFYGTWYFWLILLPTTSVITMRLFSLEKFSGTFETLMTAPVSDRQVVAAKFTAALLFYAVVWALQFGCLLVVRHYASDPAAFDGGAIASTFLGLLLLGALLVSLGCCASALTRSQVAAAMISLVLGFSLFLVAFLAEHVRLQTTWQAQVLSAVAFFQQMHDFARGVVDTRAVVLYLSLTLFFLFLTLRIIESRRWR